MLLQSELQSFFEINDIPIEGTDIVGLNRIDEIFLKALAYGYSFASFLLTTTFNSGRDGFETTFKTWNNLYEDYACFVTGQIGYQC